MIQAGLVHNRYLMSNGRVQLVRNCARLRPPRVLQAVKDFQGSRATVLLMNINACAMDLSLTAADHDFLLEPALNPALEKQVVGHVWRMGQTRPVSVTRFYVMVSCSMYAVASSLSFKALTSKWSIAI